MIWLSKWCKLTAAARAMFHMQQKFRDSASRSAVQFGAVWCYYALEGGLRGWNDVL
jgi:hypothetical protein